MYLDQLPDLSRAKLVRAHARGVAIRDGARAVAVAFVADGSLLPADTLVRFDVTQGEDPPRRLADALAATAARTVWFYGGDEVTRRAVSAMDLVLRPVGATFVRRMDAARVAQVGFRPPSQRDRLTLPDLQRDHAPAFRAPLIEVAEIGGESVALVLSEALDAHWTELRLVVYPPHRGHGYASVVLAAAADRAEATGKRVCAAIETVAGRERAALESAGFRLADYYFTASRAPKP
ncbi:MAG TPA: GNAT family N-acetyltransferase [Candidatus Sulfotelmatobacter sp.]|nr:GNAT family N-acetyltransferase [Candidatus Sulfotelmatobacter sp.]